MERLEAKKARDRKLLGKDLTDQGTEGKKGETREIVGKASEFGSAKTYDRAKYFQLRYEVYISKSI